MRADLDNMALETDPDCIGIADLRQPQNGTVFYLACILVPVSTRSASFLQDSMSLYLGDMVSSSECELPGGCPDCLACNDNRCMPQEPVLRTSCSRMAFQTTASAALRVSIDTDLRFTKVCPELLPNLTAAQPCSCWH